MDFNEVVKLMKTKAHLTKKGLSSICEIKAGMNRGRKIFFRFIYLYDKSVSD